ncbi:MAG: hypothetical protein MUC49_06750 [Raineya sp.]|jgi:hypothetical protein|nr:hypothetical protein [Raineya sp.]
MKLKSVLFGLFLTGSYCVSAQTNIGPSVGGVTLAPFTSKGKNVDDANSYFSEEWSSGSLFINVDSKGLPVSNIKYNIANDKILMKDGDKLFEFPKGSVLSFTLKAKDKETGVLRDYTFLSGLDGIDKYKATNFFLVHYNSPKVKLLTKHFVVLQKSSSSTYGSNAEEFTYSKEQVLFIYKDSKGILIKKNKKSVLEALGGDKKIWEEYIKANKLDMKNEEDIARLLKYYESKNI